MRGTRGITGYTRQPVPPIGYMILGWVNIIHDARRLRPEKEKSSPESDVLIRLGKWRCRSGLGMAYVHCVHVDGYLIFPHY